MFEPSAEQFCNEYSFCVNIWFGQLGNVSAVSAYKFRKRLRKKEISDPILYSIPSLPILVGL